MKLLIQRVKQANVVVENQTVGEIGQGFLVFLGVAKDDTKEIADKMVRKMLQLRIFEDENGKTNLSIQDPQVMGSLLIVSQFTLYADCKHGNRPSFVHAAMPDEATALYEYVLQACETTLPNRVQHGVFGADMKVALINDGPFTVLLDSAELC